MAYKIKSKKQKRYGKKHDYVLLYANEEVHFKTKEERDKYAKSGRILWDFKGEID